MTLPRLLAVATWAVFACIALGVLVAQGDVWGLALGAAWALLALVEGLAIANPERGDTISNRISSWLRDRPWRALALGVVMLGLFIHWLADWP